LASVLPLNASTYFRSNFKVIENFWESFSLNA
jgi:hypothetical protein